MRIGFMSILSLTLIVSLFHQGHGVMVFEDGTHYEGEFRAAGVFGGKGTLIFNSGDRLEGILQGAWNEGVKITGTLHKNTTTLSGQLKQKPR
jgi:amyotrophic lateral sclerosis 2 protein